MEQAIEH